MSDGLAGVVVSHGVLGEAFVQAVRAITGLPDGLHAITNEGCDRAALLARLTDAIGDRPAVVFTDLPSGSCLQAAVGYLRTHDQVAVVAGVNLAMLIDFVYHRDAAPAAAAARAAAKGGQAVRALP
jgi:mannose/fructose-specific phosphotransferase system component IIA